MLICIKAMLEKHKEQNTIKHKRDNFSYKTDRGGDASKRGKRKARRVRNKHAAIAGDEDGFDLPLLPAPPKKRGQKRKTKSKSHALRDESSTSSSSPKEHSQRQMY